MDGHDRRLVSLGVGLGVAATLGGGVFMGGRQMLRRQAAIARQVIGHPHGEVAPSADKVYKKRFGDPWNLLVLGDSVAAGLGAEMANETLGARLAKGLAKRTHRSVRLTTRAVIGAETSMLADQLGGVPANLRPDIAVIVVGGNDVTHRIPVAESVADLVAAVRTLQERGWVVVVGTCPDLGALRPVPQPLRSLGSRASRQLAAAQREAVLAEGAYAVSLADVVGPFFITNPDEMFSLDRFHPSSMGYRRTAKAMLPSVLAALGVDEDVPFGHHAPVAST